MTTTCHGESHRLKAGRPVRVRDGRNRLLSRSGRVGHPQGRSAAKEARSALTRPAERRLVFRARYTLGTGFHPYKSWARRLIPIAPEAEKALTMPSPTDRNLTALPTKTVKPQSRRQARHWTKLDQVTQLVAARGADPDLGFMARLLSLCSLPRTNPKNRHEFKRVNGPYTLYMVAGGGNKLPYGTLPRLLLAWVCTEAVRTQSPELILGDSLSEFMRKVGIYSTSGDKHTRLRNQMRRLFGCTVSLLYEDADAGTTC